MITIRLLVPVSLLASALMLSACASQERSYARGGGERRVYNPQTRNYEWQRPGKPPTSPGADRTRRAPYH